MHENVRERMKDSLSFLNNITKTTKRCIDAVLEAQPKCHFGALHRLVLSIQADGTDGKINVSDLSRTLCSSPQAVSRCLRVLEQDGLIERCTDPNDRRKTMVYLTDAGQQAHDACEAAMQEYGTAVAARLGAERLQRIRDDFDALIAAMEAEASREDTNNSTGDAYV